MAMNGNRLIYPPEVSYHPAGLLQSIGLSSIITKNTLVGEMLVGQLLQVITSDEASIIHSFEQRCVRFTPQCM